MSAISEAVRLILNTGRTNEEIGQMAGVSRNTVRRYRVIVEEKGLQWPTVMELGDRELESIFRKPKGAHRRKRRPDLDYSYNELQKPGVTRQTLFDEYVEQDPETALGKTQFYDLIAKYTRKLSVTMRQTRKAGECVWVDYAGKCLYWKSRNTGELRRTQLFVAVLGASGYIFVCATASQKLPDWIEAHNAMFRFYGGVPEVIIPDNLKSAVTKASADPVINRTYRDLALHYGTVILPARPRRPKDKAPVEAAVRMITWWVIGKLRNRQFFSLAEINAAIVELLPIINARPIRLLNQSRRERFEQLDQPLLRSLPDEPFEYAEWTAKRKVPPDYHIEVERHFYSVPHELVGDLVEARITTSAVEIYANGKRVALHVRSSEVGGSTTLATHQSPAHRSYAQKTPGYYQDWARTVGRAATSVVDHQFLQHRAALPGLKACSNLRRLCREYGDERFEAACQRAERIGSMTVTSITSILKRRLDQTESTSTSKQVQLPLHHNVRGAGYYVQEGR